jgi:4-hydroxy-tetrahydrodipicolinate synthase
LVDLTPKNFDVIQGCDTLIYPAMLYGAKGAVTGTSNVFPEIFVKLYRAILDKDYVQAKEMQKVVNIVCETFQQFRADFACLKKALEFRGFKPIYTRKPLLDMEEDEANKLEKDIKLITDKYL